MTTNFGYVRVAAAVPTVKVGGVTFNGEQIESMIRKAEAEGAQIALTPELSLTGYTCGDLVFQRALLDAAQRELMRLVEATAECQIAGVVGLPIASGGALYNCAVMFGGGRVLGVTAKGTLTKSERRWFATPTPGAPCMVSIGGESYDASRRTIRFEEVIVGIEFGSEMWAPIPPSSTLALEGAQIILNPAAIVECAHRRSTTVQLLRSQSLRTHSAHILAAAGFGESSTDEVYVGAAIAVECGEVLAESEHRVTTSPQLLTTDIDTQIIEHERMVSDTFTPTPSTSECVGALPPHRAECLMRPKMALPFCECRNSDQYATIFETQCAGLMQRLTSCGIARCVVGISGGLDSTLALLVTVEAYRKLGRPTSDIVGITMPGFGTTSRTHDNAIRLMEQLGVTTHEISIRKACEQHFSDIGLAEGDHSVTFENAQARERTQILMDYANRIGAIVIGTGDMSELALGWATYNGDHMSMYGVNAGVPKTLVRRLTCWYAAQTDDDTAATLADIIDTPISPELLPADDKGEIAQQTEDLVGPYELHDFFLYNILRYGFSPAKVYALARHTFGESYTPEVIKHWLGTFVRRFFNQQFKRSAMPDGPRVEVISLSPRGAWSMPSDASAAEWLREVSEIES